MSARDPVLIEEIIKKASAPSDFISSCEQEYEDQLNHTVDTVIQRADQCPIILLSGPSGSGKTTSGIKLKEALEHRGFTTHILSLDDYFLPITDSERPLFKAHKLDLESPERVDVDFLNGQLEALASGAEVELPKYNFLSSTRESSKKKLKLRHGDLLVLEGIHSLNPSVVRHAEDFCTGIYVSVRSRIEHKKRGESYLLHPAKIRLARRIIRDGRTRNRTPSDLVALYNSVELGENKYIMPYKERAHTDINSFFACELCLYKSLLPSSLPEDEKNHPWLSELFEVLSELPALSPELLPDSSLLREFIGGGKYGD